MCERQEDDITKLLGLQGWKAEKVEVGEKEVLVYLDRIKEATCPRCGGMSHSLYAQGKAKKVLHHWITGRRIYVKVRRRRFWCKACQGPFPEEIPWLRPWARMTRQAEGEALYELRHLSFSQVQAKLGVSYGTLRRILDRGIDEEEVLECLNDWDELFLGIDGHSFRHQEMVNSVSEVKHHRLLTILPNDRKQTLKDFLRKLPVEKIREVCIDMNEGLRRAVQEVLPKVKLVVDPFHVIADANRRVDEARRIEQEALRRKRVTIPKKIFLVGNERLSDQKRERVKGLLIKYPSLQGFYWAKEKLRELYRQGDRNEAAKLLDNIIFNLKSSDDGELIRWGNTLRRWKEPILNHFENQTTNGFTEGCNTKIKMLKRISYGLRNVDVYAKKLLLAFLPPTTIYYHKI